MKRISLSRHLFVDLPDDLPLTQEGRVNIIFQYRWHAAAVPSEKTSIKAVVVYGEHPGLNSGVCGELGSVDFINKSIDKILTETGAPLGKLGFSAYSGGGIGLYNLFKNKNKLMIYPPDAVMLSDATYGGKPVLPVWSALATDYLTEVYKRFVLLHTRSLENRFDSTTRTAVGLIKSCGIESATVPAQDSGFWDDWFFKPTTWTQKGGLVILDTVASHADAGKIVPQLWNSFLSDWY